MPNTNNKMLIVSLNKSNICSDTKHPIPSQEINPRSQKLTQTRCAISLINGPQPCCCHDFSTTLFLLQFFCHTFSTVIFSAALFLPRFFCRIFSAMMFLLHFFCREFFAAIFLSHFLYRTFSAAIFLSQFFVTLFLLRFSYRTFLPQFSYHTFSTALFPPHFFCCNFSLSIILAQITFHKNRYSMMQLNERALPLIYTFM
jgi:hypothetical protein